MVSTTKGSISCSCGEVKIQFPTSMPRSSVCCACYDCQKRLMVLHEKGGPKPFETPLSKPLNIFSMPNNMEVLKGKDKLQFYKINTDETNLIQVASTCCNTFLVGHKSDYSGNSVGLYPDGGIVMENIDADRLKEKQFFSFRSHGEGIEPLPNVPELWIEPDGSFNGSEGWDTILGVVMGANAEPIDEGAKGESLEEIMASTEATVLIFT